MMEYTEKQLIELKATVVTMMRFIDIIERFGFSTIDTTRYIVWRRKYVKNLESKYVKNTSSLESKRYD